MVNEQNNTKIVGQVYPPNSAMVFTASFGVFVVVDHDAGYEAVYTCYRDSGRFRKYPFNTLCEKFYDRVSRELYSCGCVRPFNLCVY